MLILIKSDFQFNFIKDFLISKKYVFFNPSERLKHFSYYLMNYDQCGIRVDIERKNYDYGHGETDKDFNRFKKNINKF